MTRLLVMLALAVLTLAPGAVSAHDEYVYGPRPDWTRYRALAEPAIRAKITQAKLADTSNWSIEWPNGYAQMGWRHKGRFQGYFTCGYLLPIAPADGRYAHVNFVVVIDRDQVQTVDISTHESNSAVNVWCNEFVSHGKLPPASMMGAPVADAGNAFDTLGLTVQPMPEGAYVEAVAAGSRAARAGLKPGMVLTGVNGIPLANMGPAMTALLAAADSDLLTLETVTGQRLELRKAP